MLENNSYVRCLMIDFSKAFDTVQGPCDSYTQITGFKYAT